MSKHISLLLFFSAVFFSALSNAETDFSNMEIDQSAKVESSEDITNWSNAKEANRLRQKAQAAEAARAKRAASVSSYRVSYRDEWSNFLGEYSQRIHIVCADGSRTIIIKHAHNDGDYFWVPDASSEHESAIKACQGL